MRFAWNKNTKHKDDEQRAGKYPQFVFFMEVFSRFVL